MKRVGDEANVAQPAKRAWGNKSEVIAANDRPSLNALMSMYVRDKCATDAPNATGMWSRWKKSCVAGSKVANAIGLNKFPGGDPLSLWNQICGHEEAAPMEEDQQKRVAFGIENEARARELYGRLMGPNTTLLGTHDRTISVFYPWIDYGCDGHAQGYTNPFMRAGAQRMYMLEIKCPTGKPYESVPIGYMVQIQTGMAVHGMPWCDFVMYTRRAPSGDATEVEHLKVWRVHFSPDCWARILGSLLYFVDCLETDVPPEPEFLLREATDKQYFEAPFISMSVILDQDVRPEPAPAVSTAAPQ